MPFRFKRGTGKQDALWVHQVKTAIKIKKKIKQKHLNVFSKTVVAMKLLAQDGQLELMILLWGLFLCNKG